MREQRAREMSFIFKLFRQGGRAGGPHPPISIGTPERLRAATPNRSTDEPHRPSRLSLHLFAVPDAISIAFMRPPHSPLNVSETNCGMNGAFSCGSASFSYKLVRNGENALQVATEAVATPEMQC
jgi:hypothetical protein